MHSLLIVLAEVVHGNQPVKYKDPADRNAQDNEN